MVIAHNLMAMNAQRQFNIVGGTKNKSSEKLSSGYRINRAADDAAGLSISEGMRRQIRGLTQGVRNAQDGVSLCQVADGALAEVNDMLHRITELSVQSANGTNSQQDRASIQKEISEIVMEIDRISEDTNFNGCYFFRNTDFVDNGWLSATPDVNVIKNPNMMTKDQALQELREANFSIGKDRIVMNGATLTGDSAKIIFTQMSSHCLWMDYRTVQSDLTKKDEVDKIFNQIYDNLCVTSGYEASQFVSTMGQGSVQKTLEIARTFLDEAMTATNPAKLADLSDRFSDALQAEALGISTPNIAFLVKAAERYYQGLGGVDDPGSYVANTIGSFSEDYQDILMRKDLGSSVYSNLPPLLKNVDEQSIAERYIAFANVQGGYNIDGEKYPDNAPPHKMWIQSGDEPDSGISLEIAAMDTDILWIADADVTTAQNAKATLKNVKIALEKVVANRSKIGAQQNRLEHTIKNEENIIENTTAAESRIRDTDMAEEMVRFSNAGILEQAGQTMIAQANQNNQMVLSLLQ